MRILFADDDARIGKHVRQALVAEGYAVDYAEDGDEALWLAENNPYDAIILDVMMPLRDGFTIARALRRKNIQVPVMFLTAKGEIEDRVRGLDVGGDDYMVKPFSVVELLARLRALLRRQRPQASNVLKFEDLELDLVSHQARRGGKIIDLTNREFALLELLMMTAPRPVSKAVIIERVWNQFFDSQTNVVNVYVNHLRAKIDQPGLMPIVQTVRGVGFALRKPDS
jgi:two-component system, OmpR family, copper resistance phosphate regulon response regulator CusR